MSDKSSHSPRPSSRDVQPRGNKITNLHTTQTEAEHPVTTYGAPYHLRLHETPKDSKAQNGLGKMSDSLEIIFAGLQFTSTIGSTTPGTDPRHHSELQLFQDAPWVTGQLFNAADQKICGFLSRCLIFLYCTNKPEMYMKAGLALKTYLSVSVGLPHTATCFTAWTFSPPPPSSDIKFSQQWPH